MTTFVTRDGKHITCDDNRVGRIVYDRARDEEENDDDGEALARHIADAVSNAVRGALDSWNKGQDRRRGRDEDPLPTIEGSGSNRPAHQPPTGSRSERAVLAGDAATRAQRVRRQTETARDAIPGLSRYRM
ncbi:MAG TPA: hypothetical protein VHY19_06440 [Steroidobacteraceae bacterium]|jgi:hypothetical protein|nr:hypothetical protein [Steroidobacteraceae bacterium]